MSISLVTLNDQKLINALIDTIKSKLEKLQLANYNYTVDNYN